MLPGKVYFWLSLGLVQIVTASTWADPQVFGEWIPPGGDAVIAIVNENDRATLILRNVLEPDQRDDNNDDQALRQRLLTNIVIGESFAYEDGWWRDSTLYDPNTGNTYKARFQLQDADHLIMRGYIGAAAFGRSMILTRKHVFQQNILNMLNIDAGCAQGDQHE